MRPRGVGAPRKTERGSANEPRTGCWRSNGFTGQPYENERVARGAAAGAVGAAAAAGSGTTAAGGVAASAVVAAGWRTMTAVSAAANAAAVMQWRQRPRNVRCEVVAMRRRSAGSQSAPQRPANRRLTARLQRLRTVLQRVRARIPAAWTARGRLRSRPD